MLSKLLEEIGEIIASILDVVFGESVRFVITEILTNSIINTMIKGMVKLSILILALTFVIMLLKLMQDESKKEIIGLIMRFIVLAILSFYVFDFGMIFFGLVAEVGINYIVAANSTGLAENFFTVAINGLTPGPNPASIILIVNLIFLLVMYVKFLIDFGKYAIQTQVYIFTYPIYAINALASGWSELWNWFLNIFKVCISVILLTLYLSIGMHLIVSAIGLNTPLQAFGKLMLGIILMLSKKPIETALGRLGVFNQGSNTMHTVSSTSMLARNTLSMLAR